MHTQRPNASHHQGPSLQNVHSLLALTIPGWQLVAIIAVQLNRQLVVEKAPHIHPTGTGRNKH